MKNTYKTKAREEIISYLKNHPEQRLTAREIYEAVCDGEKTVDRTTIYRNLDRLCENGGLMRFKEPNQESWYYQYSSDHEHCDRHMHAQCSVCGKVFHLDRPFVDAFAEGMIKEYGLDISPADTVILGKCSECKGIKKS